MADRGPGLVLLTLLLAGAAGASLAADETHLTPGVRALSFTKPTSPPGLSLENLATIKTPQARQVTVTSSNPVISVDGRLECPAGKRVHTAQLIFGKSLIQNGELLTIFTMGASAKLTLPLSANTANFTVSGTLPVSKVATKAAVDLTFNPARQFEQKLSAFVAKGGSAAEYLRQTESFDMPLGLSLIGWCADLADASKRSVAVVNRTVNVSILYEGDQKITGGMAPNTAGSITAPAPAAPPRVKR
jgi:hypothetical protein